MVSFGAVEPVWLTDLTKRLRQQSWHMSTKRGAAGAVEFHCGMRDAASWAESFGKLIAGEFKVRASENVLTFSRGGKAVRVIMSRLPAL
jgi:hypothetical protein